MVRPGGYIFIGDVRSLPLLPMLHTGIEVGRASQQTSVGELRERVWRRIRQEQELVIEPEFFRVLGEAIAGITGVAMEVKRGWEHNELTRFRYDVVLQVEGGAPPLDEG